MRGCLECPYPLTVNDDDGTGRHYVCLAPPDRERYLREKAENLPSIVARQEQLKRDGVRS